VALGNVMVLGASRAAYPPATRTPTSRPEVLFALTAMAVLWLGAASFPTSVCPPPSSRPDGAVAGTSQR
jgi:hypothetical protein